MAPADRCTSCGFAMPERGSTLPFAWAVKLRDNPGLCLSCIERRKSAPSPAFVPAVGEMCEGLRYNGSGEVVVGKFVRDDIDGDALLDDGVGYKAVTRSSLKPATAQVEQEPCLCGAKATRPDPHLDGGGDVPNEFCDACYAKEVERLEAEPGQSPPDPYAGYDLNAWGIAAVKRPVTTCNEPGCNCPYCRHRAFSPKLGANDPRYNGGKGPAHSTPDASIAAARQATEREAGAKRFDAWVSVRHAREAK